MIPTVYLFSWAFSEADAMNKTTAAYLAGKYLKLLYFRVLSAPSLSKFTFLCDFEALLKPGSRTFLNCHWFKMNETDLKPNGNRTTPSVLRGSRKKPGGDQVKARCLRFSGIDVHQ